MDIDVGQLVYPSLKDCPVVVDLHELSPVGRRATAATGKLPRSSARIAASNAARMNMPANDSARWAA